MWHQIACKDTYFFKHFLRPLPQTSDRTTTYYIPPPMREILGTPLGAIVQLAKLLPPQ